MLTGTKKSNLCDRIENLSNIEEVLQEVEDKIGKLELHAEDIIAYAMNTDKQTEELAESVSALCKLVDSLRSYNNRVAEVKKNLKEVVSFL